MIGNGVCNDECYMPKCSFDDGDCYCSAGCRPELKGTCDYHCMVPSCNYDSFGQKSGCNDDVLLAMTYMHQSIVHDQNEYFDFKKCSTAGCKKEDIAAHYLDHSCMPASCMEDFCMYGLGGCDVSSNTGDCKVMEKTTSYCLECNEKQNLFGGHCVDFPPRGFIPFPAKKQYLVPNADNTTFLAPDVIYVTDSSDPGNGSYEKPYQSLLIALAAARFKYTVINLLGAKISTYFPIDTSTPDLLSLSDRTLPLANKEFTLLTIQSIQCEVTSHPLCSNSFTTIDVNSVLLFNLTGNLVVKNVTFTSVGAFAQYSPFIYCISTITSENGLELDLRGNKATTVQLGTSDVCDEFKFYSFITVGEGCNLTMLDVNVTNFRNGMASFIDIYGGNVILDSVRFVNVTADNNEQTNGFITQNYTCTSTPFCGTLQITNSIVRLLNNGYEFSENDQLSAFISAFALESTIIKNVTFSYCMASDLTNTEAVSGYALLYFEYFLTIYIENCTFESNLVTGGILAINSQITLPKTMNEKGEAEAYSLPHVTLKNVNFTGNYGGQGIVNIRFTKDVQNVFITGCIFARNVVGSQSIVMMMNSEAVTTAITSGNKMSIKLPPPKKKGSLWIPPRYITFENNTFVNQSSYTSLIYAKNFANVNVTSVLVVNNGDTQKDAVRQVFWTYNNYSDTFARKVPATASVLPCSSSIYLSFVVNFNFRNITLLKNSCSAGGVGLSLDTVSGSSAIADLYAKGNSGTGSTGLAVDVNARITIVLTNFTIEDNSMNGGGMICFEQYSNVSLSVSGFQRNTGERGACISAIAGMNLTLWNSKFIQNSSPLNIGGVLSLTLDGRNLLRAEITDCIFRQNSATEGGVFAFSALKILRVDLIVVRNEFSSNTASQKAAVMSIKDLVALSDVSTVNNCSFTGNDSPYGVISTLHYSGTLSITNSNFMNNSGSVAAILHIESQQLALTILKNLIFENSKRGPALLKTNSRVVSQIVSTNCLFRNNDFGAVTLEGGIWSDNQTLFTGAKYSGISLTMGAKASIFRSNFTQNSNTFGHGGGAYLASKSTLYCEQCIFTDNLAVLGGAIYSEQDSVVLLNLTKVERNRATNSGSAIALITSLNSISKITASNFTQNFAVQNSLIVGQNAVFELDSVLAYENSAGDFGGISLLLSTVMVNNCTFRDQSAIGPPYMYVVTQSIAVIRNSSFSNGQGLLSGAIYVVSSSLEVISTTFRNIHGDQVGVIFAGSVSEVIITDCLFSNVTSRLTGSLIVCSDSILDIAASFFMNYNLGGIYGNKMAEVSLSDCDFVNGNGSIGTAFFCSQCEEVTITNSVFSYQSGTYGAAVYIETVEGAKSAGKLTITGSQFSSNKGLVGGAMYIKNMIMDLRECLFGENSANDGDGEGGAIYLDCTIVEFCEFNLTNTKFVNNVAKVKGGAISWNRAKPNTKNLTMIKNKANYGPEIASFPITLLLQGIQSTKGIRVLMAANSTTISQTPPGQPTGLKVTASLVDHYGNIVNIDSTSPALLVSTDLTKASVSGISKVSAVNGTFVFDNFNIFADPNTTASVNIETPAILRDQPGDPNAHSPLIPMSFEMRECVPGESQTVKSCFVCEPGTYGFDPKLPCDKCPANARCLGNMTIYPNSGFWRSGILSSRIWPCPNPDACLGGIYNSTYNLTGGCTTGFTSNMCQSCMRNYSRTSKNKCGLCPDQQSNIVKLTFVGMGAVILNIILVSSTLKGATKPTQMHSIYLKILMNYLQLVMLVTDFKLSWPKPVLSLFDAQEQAGGVTQQAYSFDCFLAGDNSVSDIYFQKIIFMALLPVLLLVIAILIWLILAYNDNKPIYLKRELAATIVILFFMIHPNLVLTLFSMFSCTEINTGESWLTIDMSIKCWEGKHIFYSLVVGLPAIIVWVFVVPFICLGILIKFRRQQDELWLKMQYGFLINGYRRRRFYWEFVIMYRKIAIILCAVFLNNSVGVQALTVQFVILVFLFLQFNTLPYTHPTLNSLELKAIITADLTIYCGLYYLTEGLSDISTWFFFILIVVANAAFILYWVKLMFDYAMVHFIVKVHFLAQWLVPDLLDRDAYIESFVDNTELKNDYEAFEVSKMDVTTIYKKMLKVRQEDLGFNLKIEEPKLYEPKLPLPQQDSVEPE